MDMIHEKEDLECNTGMDGKQVQMFQMQAFNIVLPNLIQSILSNKNFNLQLNPVELCFGDLIHSIQNNPIKFIIFVYCRKEMRNDKTHYRIGTEYG